MNSNLTEAIRTALPDTESVLIAALCLGTLVIVLDGIGIDLIENLRGMDQWKILYPVGFAFVSKIVERFREAFESESTVSERSM